MFSQADFRVFAEALAQDNPGIRSLQLAPNSVVTYVYPLKGNQAALGHDLMADPARREAVQRAIKGRKFILAGPVNLRQGGVAVIGRLPIFVPIPGGGETEADRYWGLAIILIDLEPLLANAGILDQSKGMQFTLRGKDGLGAEGAVFFGDGTVFDADPVVLDVSVPNGSWQLAAIPKEGWTDAWAGQIWLLTVGSALAVIVGWLVFIVLRKPVQLSDSERLMRDAIESISDGFALYDAKDRLVLFNTKYREGLSEISHILKAGVRFEEVIRALAERGLLPDGKGRVEDCVRDRLDLHRRLGAVAEQPFGDDQWVQINRYRTTNGGTVVIRTDITERKRAEEALRESEERYRRIYENTPVMLHSIDKDGRLLSVSDHWLEVLGYERDEVIGQKAIRFMTEESARYVAKTTLPEFIKTGRHTDLPLQFVKKTGQVIDVLLSAVAERDEAGEFARSLTVLIDITERKKAEDALRESEERFRGAIESLQEGFALYDAEDRLVVMNDEYRRLNTSAQEIFDKGLCYEDLLRANIKRGAIADAIGREEEFVRERLEQHRNPKGPFIRRLANGISYIVKEARTPDDGIAVTLTDITELKRTEEALRESEEQLRAVIDHSPGAIVIKDLEGRNLIANKRFCSWYGSSGEKIIGKSAYDFLTKEIADQFTAQEHKVIETGTAIEEERQVTYPDGVTRAVFTQKFPIFGPDGDCLAVGTVINDITERKRAEVVIRESEKRFRTLIDSSSQGILVHRHFQPLYVNPTLVEMLGYDTVEDILALDSAAALFAPEEKARMRGYHEARLRGEFAPNDCEFKGLRKDGSEIWLSNRAFQIEWKDGPAICTTLFDITQRKQAEEKLRESEERLRLSLAAARVGTFCWDIQEDMNFWDDRMHEIWGLEPGTNTSTATKDILANVHPEDAERVSQAISRTLNDDAEHDIEYRIVRPDQSIAYIQELAAVVRDDQKRPLKLIGVCLDITGRKWAEEEKAALELEVQQAGRMEAIGLLAGGIAHEINTPIQYIGDNLHFLNEACRDIRSVVKKFQKLAQAARDKGVLETEVREADSAADEADLEYLLDEFSKATRQSIEGTGKVAEIVLAMKEFSHPSMKEKVTADINHAIKSTLTVSRNEWKHVAEVDLDLDGTLAPVICLAGEVNQVFLNLIINAVHAIAAKGGDGKERITVSTRQDGDWVEIRVADTGTGIPENVRDKIFNPFFTTKEVGKGTGQGLAICHDIVVNKHGGKIFFETEMGKGTTFVVRLPLDAQEKASEAA